MEEELNTLDRNVEDGNWCWDDFYEDQHGTLKALDTNGLLQLIVRLAKFHEFWENKDPENKEMRMSFGGRYGSYQWIADWPTIPGDLLAEEIKKRARSLVDVGFYNKDAMTCFLSYMVKLVQMEREKNATTK